MVDFRAFLLIAYTCICFTGAFKWDVHENLPVDRYFTFSERYMFSDRNGPVLMNQGASFIKVNMEINTFSKVNRTVSIAMATYAAAEEYHDSVLDGLCESGQGYSNTWASYVEMLTIPTQYVETLYMNNPFIGLNGTYYHRKASIKYHYTVRAEAWHNVVFVVCPATNHFNELFSAPPSSNIMQSIAEDATVTTPVRDGRVSSGLLSLQTVVASAPSASSGALIWSPTSRIESFGNANTHIRRQLSSKLESSAYLTGTIAFHNPYGYIPAELFGLLPFQTARVLAYLFFSVFFVGHYYQYRESTLSLHTAFLMIFIFGLVESILWFASYQSLNISGVPYCCPFPPLVVGSLVLQVVRQTLSRTLFLVVCLGYGIVRPKLMPAEWVAVCVISGLYLCASFLSQGAVILFAKEAHGNFSAANAQLTPYKIPAMVLDVIFLTWIYLAINSTIRILTEFQQTAKLSMYKQLVAIIGVFVVFFAVVTTVFLLDGMGFDFVPWQSAWLEQVLWESLNFAVLAAVCVVCRPTATSQMLSYASQLPTEDPDLDDDDERHGGGSDPLSAVGPWSNKGRAFVYGGDGDLDDDEELQREAVHDFYNIGKHAAASNSNGQIEMGPLGSTQTRNPLSATIPSGGLGRKPRKEKQQQRAGFDSLPQAEEEDEEYGLEQDDWR